MRPQSIIPRQLPPQRHLMNTKFLSTEVAPKILNQKLSKFPTRAACAASKLGRNVRLKAVGDGSVQSRTGSRSRVRRVERSRPASKELKKAVLQRGQALGCACFRFGVFHLPA